jgi:hypothetical protein
MSNPIAVPGTNVPSGAAVAPGGAQGIGGPTVVSTDSGNIATLGTDNRILVPQSSLWSMRLRSYNSVQNCNFEVDQRNIGNLISVPAGGTTILCDRWAHNKPPSATLVASIQRVTQNIYLPGTSFLISQGMWRDTLTTQQASLGATDVLQIFQTVEGPQFRELAGDVTSISLLVRSSVANLKFSVALSDPTFGQSLVKLATIPSANTWTLLQFPNIPQMSGGSFAASPGSAGYVIKIGLAVGSTYIAPAADTWQSGNFIGAPGMSNFAAQAVNSTFDIAFCQHEPGSQCTTLIDCPFSGPNGNLESCQRYFIKSYSYGVKPGTADINGRVWTQVSASSNCYAHVPFKRTMAKVPTITGYSPPTGAVNNVRDENAGLDRTISAALAIGDSDFGGFNLGSVNGAGTNYSFHYIADTGW